MRISRREFLGAAALSLAGAERIHRRALVDRHNPVVTGLDPLGPLTVGNGEFAFTADVTGLQTFPELYESGIPLCTQSQWGWHSFPPLKGLSRKDLRLERFDTYGRQVGYATSPAGQVELFNWLRENPHRLHLGRIGLRIRKGDGSAATPADLRSIRQTLDLWSGLLTSRFEVDGEAVEVVTCCHPARDELAVTIRSALLKDGRLAVALEFPYGSPQMNAADWRSEERHRTAVVQESAGRLRLLRELDTDRYWVQLGWRAGSAARRAGPHSFLLQAAPGSSTLELACVFSPRSEAQPADPAARVIEASRRYWERFWTTGAAVDFSGSRDGRARELERRVILSQYLTAIQCCGSMPPQETGLTCNSWYGKFHLEMHWWHAAHFPMWGREALLERSLEWYASILPSARQRAREQGYAGARWPKMSDPEGNDSPSAIGPLLIWQQPHPIVMAESIYQVHPGRAVLEKYREIVMESAEFMASYAHLDPVRGRYVLGPPLIPAQENHPPRETWNPTYELEYWHHALGVAQHWRERLGMRREPKWDEVRDRLSPLPTRDGIYLAHENCPQTYAERNRDHPSMLMALGVLPGERVDRQIMRNTLRKVLEVWDWPSTWGWDYPVIAMTAARLGERTAAVDALFLESPKNRWLANGHNYQRPNLPLYLPGNGGLLIAVAMMAAGWRGGPAEAAPGFPKGEWEVRQEGLRPLL
ncbi:MAG: glycoside hydrolase family 65 [Bryobacteraceae bacterium]|nr:glycoside hydrolase family 65 [Bryobacteraceae bacterium]